MKWLYRILRLFRCPHRWVKKEEVPVYEGLFARRTENQLPAAYRYILCCKYCGDLKMMTVA